MKKVISRLLSIIMAISFVVPTTAVFAATSARLNVTSKSGVRGDTVSVAVNISSGSNMQACGFDLKYDKNVLEVIDATKGVAISAKPVINKGVLGKIVFAYVSTSPVTSSGSVLNVTFKIKENASYGKSSLELVLKEMSDGSFNKINTTANGGSVTVIAPQLEAPSGLSSFDKSSDFIDLFWDAVDGATGYNLYINGAKINTSPITENTFRAENLTQNTQYQFAVSSINYTTESGKSETINVKTDIGKNIVFFVDWRYDGSIGDGGADFIIDVKEVEHGGTAIAPDAPAREGYTFTGWDKPLTNITGFTVIQAQYAKSTYKVTFLNYNGTKLGEQQVEFGGNATSPTVPARVGYSFLSWSSPITNITAPITVTAQYMPNKYNIAYNANGGTGTMANSSHTYDEEIALNANAFSKAGAKFDSWNTKADGTGTKYTNAQIVKNLSNINDKTITLYAIWNVNSYTVTFKGMDGNIISTISNVAHNTSVTAPAIPNIPGYTFTGWDKPLTNITESKVIQAQYVKNIYKVTFLNYDGTKLGEQQVEFGSNATSPTVPARTGYTFLNWSASINNITAPITVTAQYMPNKYNIAYNANGGTGTMANSSHTYDQEIALNANTFSKAGAIFDSWNTKADGTGTKYTNAQIVKNLSNINGKTITLYAIWNVTSHTVTFKGMDGKIISTINNVAHNTSVTAPAIPNIPGYTFTGWDKPLTNIISDTIITAVYTKINENAAQIIVSNEKGSAGKTVVVSISLKNNPGITGAKIKVGYDSTKLKLISAVDSKLLNDGLFGNDINANPYALLWDEMTTVNNTKSGVIAVLTFKILEDCKPGKTDITICNPPEMSDAALKDVSFAIQSGSVDIVKYISGDVNDDGEINSKDAALLRRYVAEWKGITVNELAADVNRDGTVNSKDAAILRRYVAEWTGIVLK